MKKQIPSAKLILYDCGHSDGPPNWGEYWKDITEFLAPVMSKWNRLNSNSTSCTSAFFIAEVVITLSSVGVLSIITNANLDTRPPVILEDNGYATTVVWSLKYWTLSNIVRDYSGESNYCNCWQVFSTFSFLTPTTRSWCATKAQVANGCKSRPGNWRFIPVATQTVG